MCDVETARVLLLHVEFLSFSLCVCGGGGCNLPNYDSEINSHELEQEGHSTA